MPKHPRAKYIKYYTPKKKSSKKTPKKPTKSHGPVGDFFVARWTWFKGLSKPKKAAVIGTPILAFLILTPIATYIYFANVISDPDRLMNYNNTGVVLLDKDGETFYSFGTADRGDRVPLDQISDYAEDALISSEDKNFYDHGGFSIISIIGAFLANLTSGDATAYGGSTITQQLAKNTLLTDQQTIFRKYQELTISIAIEQNYTKDEILEMYLNSVYYGEGAFGIEAAAEAYFDTSAAELDLAESAMLIGVLPAPSAYSPISGTLEYAEERQETVLGRMVDNNAITQEEADEAGDKKLAYADPGESVSGSAPHFAEMILNQLYEEYGEEVVTRAGYRVTTTLDADLQAAANDAIETNIDFIELNGGSNASVVAIDPENGEIRALVGSSDYSNADFGKVNMATTARQPGSSIKPLYYAEALQRSVITPATILEDKPTDFGGGYRPLNADRQFRGDVTVRNAISQSLNIPSVEVMQMLGVENSVDALQRMGLSTIDDSTDYGLSLALGSAEAQLDEMTNAYAALANSGQQYETTTIIGIEDKYESEVFKKGVGSAKEVMNAAASFLISDILNDEAARAPIFGGSLDTPGYDVAVKTGTTDEARDAWTIGYSKQLAVGVWVGNNDNTPMNNGGSGMAGPIWRQTIMAGLSGEANQPFEAPDNVETVRVCRSNGLRATGDGTDGTYTEYFIIGTVPSGTCEVKEKPKDADKDGVIDEDDECANTPRNAEVDEEGCEVVEEEEPVDPVDTDSDGDGVADGIDECADTPEGVEVDETGCEIEDTENGGSTSANGARNFGIGRRL